MDAEGRGVGEQQQGVVQEALQHGRLHPGIGQVLTAARRPTDQQGQDLAHGDGLQQPAAERERELQFYVFRLENIYFVITN